MLSMIADKLQRNIPLSQDDGRWLFREAPLHQVGQLADSVRKRFHGDKTYYVVNAHINPTNICRIGCPLCAFAAEANDTRGYVLKMRDVLERARRAVDFGATQLHLVSSIHPEKPYTWYRNMLAAVHATFPALKLKAWTAVEIFHFSESSGLSVEEILRDLQSVGLSSLPGGGAEIFDSKIRRQIAPQKIPAENWLDIHRSIPTNATMLFGHLETPEHRLDHLLRLRECQDQSLLEGGSGFDCFVPLVFHPENTQLAKTKTIIPISPQEILRTIAVSRLMLHNFRHIKTYWVTLGEELAQVALSYGGDDFDGTVFEERIHHDAGSSAPRGLTVERICQFIQRAQRIPELYTNTY